MDVWSGRLHSLLLSRHLDFEVAAFGKADVLVTTMGLLLYFVFGIVQLMES